MSVVTLVLPSAFLKKMRFAVLTPAVIERLSLQGHTFMHTDSLLI